MDASKAPYIGEAIIGITLSGEALVHQAISTTCFGDMFCRGDVDLDGLYAACSLCFMRILSIWAKSFSFSLIGSGFVAKYSLTYFSAVAAPNLFAYFLLIYITISSLGLSIAPSISLGDFADT